mmetsp:Transcript_7120/g.18476  ORF Transcript_7120/g.18476 Transcript_7120/m.18476 type:complete len:231 (+) Transcript_7120:1153-1845(+)
MGFEEGATAPTRQRRHEQQRARVRERQPQRVRVGGADLACEARADVGALRSCAQHAQLHTDDPYGLEACRRGAMRRELCKQQRQHQRVERRGLQVRGEISEPGDEGVSPPPVRLQRLFEVEEQRQQLGAKGERGEAATLRRAEHPNQHGEGLEHGHQTLWLLPLEHREAQRPHDTGRRAGAERGSDGREADRQRAAHRGVIVVAQPRHDHLEPPRHATAAAAVAPHRLHI